jgi:cell division protein FtsQ
VRPASVVVPFPHERLGVRLARAKLVPSGRSIVAAFALLAFAGASYLIARDTSVFAVRSVSVQGAPPSVAAQVRDALRGDLGRSLLRVDLATARTSVTSLPTVSSVSFDRAFPHTLRVTVVPERPVAVVRQGLAAWLVSAHGRVMALLQRGAWARLPRIWIAQSTATFSVGSLVDPSLRPALEAVAPLAAMRFPARVSSVTTSGNELTLVLRSGIEVRLGDMHDVALKLVVAANVLPLVSAGTRYVDVSVPERPVSGSAPPATPSSGTGQSAVAGATAGSHQSLNSQVEIKTPLSTGP